MSRHQRQRGFLLVLTVLTCWLAIACGQLSPTQVAISEKPTNCHLVEHIAGVTCVPNTIQRLVALDSLSFEYAVALGFRPVGAPLSLHTLSYLQEHIAGVENIGLSGEADLERILALKPDLILGLEFNQDIYAQVAKIAPTLLLPFNHSGEWKQAFQRYGKALNREAIAQEALSQYQRRLQELNHKLKTERSATQEFPFPPQVSVVRIYPTSINVYFRDSFCGTILKDAGLARPVAQNLTAIEARQLFSNEVQASISLEKIEQVDGDVMFVWTSENSVAANQTAQEQLARLQSSPLLQQLNVYKKDHIYFVPNYWIGSGPLAANAVIDDLFKYLVKQS